MLVELAPFCIILNAALILNNVINKLPWLEVQVERGYLKESTQKSQTLYTKINISICMNFIHELNIHTKFMFY